MALLSRSSSRSAVPHKSKSLQTFHGPQFTLNSSSPASTVKVKRNVSSLTSSQQMKSCSMFSRCTTISKTKRNATSRELNARSALRYPSPSTARSLAALVAACPRSHHLLCSHSSRIGLSRPCILHRRSAGFWFYSSGCCASYLIRCEPPP